LASAFSFSIGAVMPLIIVFIAPQTRLVAIVFGTTLVFLAGLGTLAAIIGGAPILRAALRVTFWGALAMVITALVGTFFGKIV
jgi:VIT1/CCC1 family predicted Fe2+/Mn2+ transporter